MFTIYCLNKRKINRTSIRKLILVIDRKFTANQKPFSLWVGPPDCSDREEYLNYFIRHQKNAMSKLNKLYMSSKFFSYNESYILSDQELLGYPYFIEKTIDISSTSSNRMKFVNMHD